MNSYLKVSIVLTCAWFTPQSIADEVMQLNGAYYVVPTSKFLHMRKVSIENGRYAPVRSLASAPESKPKILTDYSRLRIEMESDRQEVKSSAEPTSSYRHIHVTIEGKK